MCGHGLNSTAPVTDQTSSGNTRCFVHVEEFASPQEAISREKQLKNWRRDWKIRLIEEANPDWSDLSHLL